MGDYNVEITETNMSSFGEIYYLTDVIKQSTCFKNPSNPSCLDLFLTEVSIIKLTIYTTEPYM